MSHPANANAWDSLVEAAKTSVDAAQSAARDAVAFGALLRRKEELTATLTSCQQAGAILAAVQRSLNAAFTGFAHPVRMDRRGFDSSRALADRAGNSASWRWGIEPVLRRLLSDLLHAPGQAAVRSQLSMMVAAQLRTGIATHPHTPDTLWSLYDGACAEIAALLARSAEEMARTRIELAAAEGQMAGCRARLESLASDVAFAL